MTEQINIPELRFPEFKEEWKLAKFKDIFIFHNNFRKPIKESLRVRGQYPYYGATGIIDYVDDFIFDGNYILIGEDGANIISRSAPLVYLSKGKFWVNNHAHILTPSSGDIHYLYQVAELVNYEKYNTGTAQPKLNIQNLKNISVNISMNLAEQEKIGTFFSKLDRQIELEEKKLELLEQQKRGYMQKIFSQELRFKDENGKDYPAWEIKKLGDLYKYQQGQQIPVENQYKIPTNNMKRFIRIVDITENPKKRYIKDRKESGLINRKDLIMIRYGASAGTISMGYEGVIANNLFKFVKKQNVDNRYFYFLLKKSHFKIKSLSSQSAMPALNFNAMDTLKFSIPQYSEQQKIGDFFSELDKLVEKKVSKIELLKQRKQGLLQKMFV